MYKEYRDVTLDKAAQKLFDDLAGRHKAQRKDIHIIDVREISDHEVKRDRVSAFTQPNLKFKNPFRVPKAPTKRQFRVFTKRPISSRFN